MKYYLIAGEASGDLHASNLMKALKQQDSAAEFRFCGGDLMMNAGGTCVKHYRDMAYMGFIPVLLHLRTIFRNLRYCKQDILDWKPDVLILIDYPGFNLKIAQFIKQHSTIPVYYYISPTIWAWKEYRIKNIKRDIDKLLSILPFEVDFFKKHHYPINYVGNPCVDAVHDFRQTYRESREEFLLRNQLDSRPIVALLAGSRKQEIKDNLTRMTEASKDFPQYQFVIAGAPGIDPEFYRPFIGKDTKIIFGQTYPLLSHATAALVTSGTATLETALFRVPQVVCYYTAAGKLVSFLRRHMLKVPYISLVNLIAGHEAVTELVADGMTVANLQAELRQILPDGAKHAEILADYDRLIQLLGEAGASQRAAESIISSLKIR